MFISEFLTTVSQVDQPPSSVLQLRRV